MNRNYGKHLLTRRSAVIGSMSLGTSLLLAPATLAQESTPASATPAASPAAEPVVETQSTPLMAADIDELPEAPFTVRLLRITLEPGAITPMHTHHGPEIDMVESGEVMIRSLGDAPVTRADGSEETSTGDDMTLAVGDMVHFPAEIGMYFENQTDDDVVLLSSVIIPVGADYRNERITWVDGEPDTTGISYQKLGDGLVQELDQQAATWTVNDVTLSASAELPAIAGIGMITPVKGNLSFKVESGAVQVTRADSEMIQPNALVGSEFSLGDADGAFFPAGVAATSREDEANPLRMLAMEIAPANGVGADPATLTFTEGDGTLAGESQETETGTIVTTTDQNVNVREEPSVDADVVTQLDEGVELEVLEGPEEADDYTWYRIRVNEEDGAEGWVASDFITEVQGTTAESQAEESDGTASGTDVTPAAAGEFEVGTTVVTNDENVRLRSEPTTDGDAIDALAEGTELLVTGEPEEGDGYTWLPVETEDGVAGYVVIDYVEKAP